MKDLVVVVPDQDYEFTLKGLFSRPEALKISPISYEIRIDYLRDPGCRTESVSFLRPFIAMYAYALVFFDMEGCGAESTSREQVESILEEDMAKNGWENRSAVVVIDPEIEAWVWSESPRVDEILGWKNRKPDMRSWLQSKTDFWDPNDAKPSRPKEAMRSCLRHVRKQPSASIFNDLAQKVSLRRCSDPSFIKLKAILSNWFGNK